MNIIAAILVLFLGLSVTLQAQMRDEGISEDRSSQLTPTAPRKVTLASPEKPSWLAEPHGK